MFKEKEYKKFDKKYSNQTSQLGAKFVKDKFLIKLWQPLAIKVEIILFSIKDNYQKIAKIFVMKKNQNVWIVSLEQKYEGYAYQFKIYHLDQSNTLALDPYATSMAPFNWKKEKIGKAILINSKSLLNGKKPQKLQTKFNNGVDPVIYELQIRDFTSLSEQKLQARKGTFLAASEAKIFDYLKKMGITHLQLLPIQSTYTINENNLEILKKGQGNGWFTNYNWGYDPHNYFTINGWFSSNPQNPYARNLEFKKFVNEAHKNGIGIILDVVYNHLMNNEILDNILPKYYFRNLKPFPVSAPSLASERSMVGKLIIDSLVYFVKEFNIDGFRFDLSSFIDKKTLNEIFKILKKINPKIVLHGEAWPFSNLDYSQSYVKGVTTNNAKFAYFNDSTRNSIKGKDSYKKIYKGLAQGNLKNFPSYVNAIVGNIKNYSFPKNIQHSLNPYDNFANSPTINLQYAACHDGFTLWDKINFSSKINFTKKIEQYRQALMMQFTTQGRQLILAGTEILQAKPNDFSGEESKRCQGFKDLEDIFNYQPDNNCYHENSYKTTDYVNGLKWKNLNNSLVHDTKKFLANLINFRQTTKFFRLNSALQIQKKISFIKAENGILIFEIKINKKTIVVIHNFTKNKFDFEIINGEILFQSKLNSQFIKNNILEIQKNCSYILRRK